MDLAENRLRTAACRKDEEAEQILRRFNARLEALEAEQAPEGAAPVLPTLFVVGAMRTGSTLLMQVLARSFRCTYPDNVVARFWGAPFLGVVVSRGLRPPGPTGGDFTSEHGVTAGPFEPHEFGYFWERWFDFSPTHWLDPGRLAAVDLPGLSRSLGLMERWGGSPLLFKVVPLSFNADFLAGAFPLARFIHVTRDPVFTAQSVYQTRLRRYGSDRAWWSLRPREYEALARLDPPAQVAGQVVRSVVRIRESLSDVPVERRMEIDYAALTASPRRAMEEIGGFLGEAFAPTGAPLPERFPSGNVPRLDPALFRRLGDLCAAEGAGEVR